MKKRTLVAFCTALCAGPCIAQTLNVVYNFQSEAQGTGVSNIVLAKSGKIYVSLPGGGPVFRGAVAELTRSGTGSLQESIIYSYSSSDCDPGASCDPFVSAGSGGVLYGTSLYSGQYHMGSVFSLTPPAEAGGAWTYSTLYSFTGGSDSGQPLGGVAVAPNGTLYGATWGSAYPLVGPPYGNVFSLSPPSVAGSPWTYTSLITFDSTTGSYPYAGVTLAKSGKLYGTTGGGGQYNSGTVFELSPPQAAGGHWSETVIYQFLQSGKFDGVSPEAPLALGASGEIYGTTYAGGAASAGTVFALTPPSGGSGLWTEHILHSFNDANGTDGFNPFTGVAIGPGGVLYGTVSNGGHASNTGIIYSLTPPSQAGQPWAETVITEFAGTPYGANPSMGFIHIGPTDLMTATVFGGTAGWGTLLELTP